MKKGKWSLHLIGLQRHSDFTWISLAQIFCQWVRSSLRSWSEWKSAVVVFGSRDARSGLVGDKLRCSLLFRRQRSTLGIKTPSVALASGSPKMKIEEYARFDYLGEKKKNGGPGNILKRSTSNGNGQNFILSGCKITCLGNLCKSAECY